MRLYFLIFFGLIFFISCRNQTIITDHSKVQEIQLGEDFNVVLPEDHRKGYTWVLNDEFDKTTLEHTSTVWHGNEKGIYFGFKALKQGTCILNFASRMYRDTSDFKSFTFKIVSK